MACVSIFRLFLRDWSTDKMTCSLPVACCPRLANSSGRLPLGTAVRLRDETRRTVAAHHAMPETLEGHTQLAGASWAILVKERLLARRLAHSVHLHTFETVWGAAVWGAVVRAAALLGGNLARLDGYAASDQTQPLIPWHRVASSSRCRISGSSEPVESCPSRANKKTPEAIVTPGAVIAQLVCPSRATMSLQSIACFGEVNGLYQDFKFTVAGKPLLP